MDRDQELEKLLTSLRAINPSEMEEARWLKAVQKEAKLKTKPPLPWIPKSITLYAAQLTAAVLVGYFAGFSNSEKSSESPVAYSDRDATIEYVSAKAE